MFMCPIQDNSRSDSRDNSSSQNGNDANSSEKYAIIKLANKKVKLLDILRHYGLKIEQNYQHQNWSNNITCPLPSHKGANERTPSFGYCFKSDHFTCLGCGKAGQAVEFISLVENQPRHFVAEQILLKYGGCEDVEDYREYQDDITPLLIDCSKFLQKQIQDNKDNPKHLKKVDKLIWWLDFYLAAKVPVGRVTSEDLKYRIERVKELIS